MHSPRRSTAIRVRVAMPHDASEVQCAREMFGRGLATVAFEILLEQSKRNHSCEYVERDGMVS
jgi:hypothetical protein